MIDTVAAGDVRSVAERLAGVPIVGFDPLARSGNNRIYCVRTANARFALKGYTGLAGPGGRLEREYAALEFLRGTAASADVPRPIASDPAGRYALYEWIEGSAVERVGDPEIDAALALIEHLYGARTSARAARLLDAVEACITLRGVLAGLGARIELLRAAVATQPEAAAFVEHDIAGSLEHYAARCRATIDPDARLEPHLRIPSPSDFSLHNALRRPDGRLAFLDFEYFGWDDPVKLVADFFWHPAQRLAGAQSVRFVRGARAIFGLDDANYTARLRAYLPIFGLKWCLIVLNEFLAEHWDRRQFAGDARSRDAARAAQLAKARRLLGAIDAGHWEEALCS